MENLLSLALIGLTIPIALAGLATALKQKQISSDGIKVTHIAQYVFHEIPYAWKNEQSILFPSHTALNFPEIHKSPPLNILFTSTGEPFSSSSSLNIGNQDWNITNPNDPQRQSNEVANGYIVKIFPAKIPPASINTDNLQQIDITIEFPAGRPAKARKSYSYSRLFRRP